MTRTISGGVGVGFRKQVDVNRRPAAGPGAILRTLTRKYGHDFLQREIEQRNHAGVHALRQRRARQLRANVQRLLVEGISAGILAGVDDAVALRQQGDVAARNDVVGDNSISSVITLAQ